MSQPPLLPTKPPIECLMGFLSLGVKRSESEADHSLPSSAEFNNMWSYISMPHMCLGVQRKELCLDFTPFM
jgi:hypothetical protein